MYRPPPGNFSPSPMGGAPPAGMPWQRPPPVTATAVWKEHTTPEGRKYWYNNVTRQSTWEKPDDLLTPEEKVFKTSPWKEYTTPEGKKYYSNSKTKQTVWDMPQELKDQIEKARKEAMNKPAPAPAAVPPPMMTPSPIVPPSLATPVRPILSSPSLTMVPASGPEFTTRAQAENAFFELLKETGVRPNWTWEQAMRAIITKPMYRALKTTGERKAAFEQWADAEAKREREEREQKEAREKSEFLHLLKHNKDVVKPYTRYRTLAKLFAGVSAYEAVPDRQREIYFEEYIDGLQRAEKERLREMRKESMEKFNELLKSIPEITFDTPWKEAQSLYHQKQRELGLALAGMDMLDFLSVYEEYNRQLWEEPLENLNLRIYSRRRKERIARDGFKALLNELVSQHKINVRTFWKEVHPLIKDDQRYLALVGLPGSTPLDLFWDVIDDLDEQLYQQKKIVYNALKKSEFEIDLDTPFEAYMQALEQDARVKSEISQESLQFIFDHLKSKAEQRVKDEKRRQEKKLKKKMDIFRHFLKHKLQPPIQLEDTWETVQPRVEHASEYKNIEDEEARIEVFNKYIKRLKEHEEDEDEEEGMIKEEDEVYDVHRNNYKRKSHKRDYDDEYSRYQKRRKDYSSAEEGEALDDYQNDPRRLK